MHDERHLLFLPGITGDGAFWRPVGERLPVAWPKTYISYPGLGTQPPSPDVKGLDDLLVRAERELTHPSVVVAQSMGGVLAVQLAARHPERVTQLVLVATSGGFDVRRHGASDWRPGFVEAFPGTPAWALAPAPDLSALWPRLTMPVLLVWGDQDTISPVAAGEFLAARLPNATLRVVAGGSHALATEHPDVVAALIATHLG
ncbi:MAG: alpha/beta hydrolase [Rubrivivax sp.]|nr:MAG: alpha/beta hydrolase [Rubrivivax sp.]